MTKRIFRAISMATLVVFVVTMILVLGVLYDYFSGTQQKQLRSETALASQAVEKLGEEYFSGLPVRDYRISWIASDGTVLYDSASSTGTMENHLERKEVKQAIATGFGESSRYSSTLMERSLYCAQRLSDGSILRLSVAHGSVLLLVFGMFQPIVLIVIVAAVLAFVLAKRLSAKIVDPLNRLNLDQPLSNHEYEEINPLLQRIHNQQNRLARMSEDLNRKEAQLEKLEAIRREFTANVSHELKTPLQSISGYSELVKCGLAKPEDVQHFSEKIYDEAQRLIALVEDIINLSHLDEGGQNLVWGDVDLYELAQNVSAEISNIAEQQKIEIDVRGEVSRVHAVPQLLHTMVYNLCDNAIKYNKEGGHVLISVSDKCLSVKDDGIGIAKENRDRIFERFYRIDKSHSKAVGGTGLGLSIVKHAAIIQNIRIELESELGSGTEIKLIFE